MDERERGRKQFAAIKELDPQLADLMTQINKTFGKPAWVAVKDLRTGEVILNTRKNR